MYSTPIFRTANRLVTNVNGIGSTGPTGPGLYYISNYENLNGIKLEDLQLNTIYYYKIQSGLSYTTGQQIIFGAYTSNNSYYFIGAVVSYNSLNGDLNINIIEVNGTGTYTNWILNLNVNTGTQGSTGYTGPTGEKGDTLWSQIDNNISYTNGNVGIGTTDTSLGALTVAGGVINAQGGLIGTDANFISLVVNESNVVTESTLPNNLSGYAQLSGADFQNLTLNGTQVATTNDLPNLNGYAQLSGANFQQLSSTNDVIINGIIIGRPGLNTNTNFLVGSSSNLTNSFYNTIIGDCSLGEHVTGGYNTTLGHNTLTFLNNGK